MMWCLFLGFVSCQSKIKKVRNLAFNLYNFGFIFLFLDFKLDEKVIFLNDHKSQGDFLKNIYK